MTDVTESAEPTEPPLDLLYSETEEDLRAAVRALLADRAGHQVVLGLIESDSPYVPGLWKPLAADIGAAGLLVPEKLGGQGASHREAAVVLEELGRAVTPLPYLSSSVVATETLLALAGESEAAAGLLAELAGGRTVAVLAVPLSTAPGAELPLTGPVAGVADAAIADVLLVPRADGLYAVPAAEATFEPQTPLDLTRPLSRVATGEEAAPGSQGRRRPARRSAAASSRGPGSSPPSSSASPSGAWRRRSGTPVSAISSTGRSVPSRPSSTAWPSSGSTSSGPGRRPARPPTPWPPAARTRR